MHKRNINLPLILFAALAVALSVWGPEALAEYADRAVLDEIHAQAVETEGEGYRYIMSSNDKLFIVSSCLNSQVLPESEQNAMLRSGEAGLSYQELEGTYAFVVNHRGPSGREITDAQIYETCNRELAALKELGVVPSSVQPVDADSYDAVLYSAIDVLEPRNNVPVWKLSLSNSQKNADKSNKLIDAYIDADSGKIYEFYVRSALDWEKLDVDAFMESWRNYMGLTNPSPYESDNPLTETTPYFKKYVFSATGGDRTIATAGFYDGINELFLKISK